MKYPKLDIFSMISMRNVVMIIILVGVLFIMAYARVLDTIMFVFIVTAMFVFIALSWKNVQETDVTVAVAKSHAFYTVKNMIRNGEMPASGDISVEPQVIVNPGMIRVAIKTNESPMKWYLFDVLKKRQHGDIVISKIAESEEWKFRDEGE